MADRFADTILHPVRMRILMTLTGQRLTTAQIGASLPEVAQASLYRHIRRLVKAEIVMVVDQQPVRGVMEKRYALAGEGSSIALDVRGMDTDDWRRGFAAFTASLMGQFSAYLRREQADPAADGVSFRTTPCYLSDAELTQISADLRSLLLPAASNGPAPGRRRRLLSIVLIPDAGSLEDRISETGGS